MCSHQFCELRMALIGEDQSDLCVSVRIYFIENLILTDSLTPSLIAEMYLSSRIWTPAP